MKGAILAGLIGGLLLLSGCADVESTSDPTFVIRGTVTQNAQTPTPMASANIQLMDPSSGGWTVISFPTGSGIPNKTVTASDGTFAYRVDYNMFSAAQGYLPMFLAATDKAQTFTMLSQIPSDLVGANAKIQMNINPITTAASLLVCPGGKYPPPSGAWCHAEPGTSTTTSQLISNIDGTLASNPSLNTANPPSWSAFMTSLLNISGEFGALQSIDAESQIFWGSATATTLPNLIATIPKVSAPIYGTDDNTPIPTSGDGSSGSCTATWSCGSSSQCVEVMGASSGTQTSFGKLSCTQWCTTYVPGSCSCSGC